jgi:TolB-like protein
MSKKHYPILIIFSLLLFFVFCSLSISSADKEEYYREKFQEKIETQLARAPKITLTANRQSTSQQTTLTGMATNVSSQTLTDLVINGMLITDEGKTGSHYQVIDIFEEQKVTVSSLSPQETQEFTFQLSGISWNSDKLHAVIFVQETHSENKEIYQAIFVQ